ncbi:hypothetical protein EVG20_g7085 [Dentipellis fragilis]|uniref:DUF3533 domain-containing protein n=1 Tax=Dentipellis fragilis TaxID=205917 RepID=A0A4Y9YI48_9AGAM|nr:hypothetical protein EVG20_g7085 [Dentipellis fragilis]
MDQEKPTTVRVSPATSLSEQSRLEPPGPLPRHDSDTLTAQVTPVSHQEQNYDVESPPFFTEGIFSRDPSTRRARALHLKILSLACVLIILCILSVLSIYWGSLWSPTNHVHNLNGYVVDFDGGQIGAFVTQAVMNSTGQPTQMSWSVVSPSLYPNGQNDLVDAVVDEKAWVIVAINAGASSNLNSAATSADESYNGPLAVTVYVEEARNENAYRTIIRPLVQDLMQNAFQRFDVQFTRQLVATNVNITNLAANAPNVLLQPAFYTLYNTRPFDFPVAAAVDYVGLIYLLILSFMFTMFNQSGRTEASHLQDRLALGPLVVYRAFIPIIAYFFISCFYSLLSVAFQLPFDRVYGHGGFVIYWMMSWLGMCALGMAVEAMVTILTVRFIAFFLIIWLIANVSVCFFPIPLLPGVFRYGYATPFYNVQRAVRTIVFGTKNQLGLNFGVQLAWIAVSLITMSALQTLQRRKAIRARRREWEHGAEGAEGAKTG